MSQKRHPEENEGPRAVGSGGPAESDGSPSPTHRRGEPKRQRVPSLREVISEVMRKSSIEKFFLAIEPLIRRVVKEEIESAFANHVTMMRRSVTDIVPSTSKNLQLQFMTKLSLPIFTGSKIEGEGSLTITIALVDALTREVLASGQESLMKVEILVLEGDFEGGEGDDWTAQEFNNNIVREREGKRPLLSGDVFVGLIKGIGTVGELSFTDNSSWTRSRKFRLGARAEDGCFNGVRVREAKTESFVVKDHRGELYKKHHPPVLEDEIWRLEKIGKEGAFHKRLNREKIVSVKDFLTLLHLDAPRLRKILGSGMSTKMWEVTVEHAKTCILTDKVHFYYPDNLSKTAVVFNVVGEVRGLISEKFVSVGDLTEKEKAEARAAVKQAYENWKNVMTCDNETLLESPSQLFNMRSPSLHENGYNQFPTQVATDGFGLSHSDIPSADIFSIVPWGALDPCALETAESNENRFQLELPPLGGHGPPQELQALDNFVNSSVYEECTSHPSFSEDYYRCADPTESFDTQDLGAALKGFIATISKPRAYRGWRTSSCVLGWLFYTKKIVALKRKKPGFVRPKRVKSVGLRITEVTESCEPINAPITPTAIQDGDLIEAVVVDSNMVAQNLTIATEATILEVDEFTPSDQMVKDLILDQPVENISSDLQLEDMRGLTSLTGLGLKKLIEQKKRKASVTNFASEVKKAEGPQNVSAEAVDSRLVMHDLTVVTETIDLEVDETTPSDQMVRNAVLDDLIENFASDILLEDVRDSTNLVGSEPANLEKKRKADGTEFTLPRFRVKSRKLTRFSGVPVVSDQVLPEDPVPVEVPDQSISQDKVPEKIVVEEASEQVSRATAELDPLVIQTPSAEVDAPEGLQQVLTTVDNPSQPNKFPFRPRFIEDKVLDEVWQKVSDNQLKMNPDLIFAGYNDLAIRHLVENFAVVGGLTQRIKDLEQKHSELENLEKIKEEIVAEKARTTLLEEEVKAKDRLIDEVNSAKDRSIAEATTRNEVLNKRIEEQAQTLDRVEKTLKFEQDKEAALAQSIDEKIHALNKMIFDMGSGSSLPILRDPVEKMNYLGQLLENLKVLLNTTRKNYAQAMKTGVANGVSFALAKLKASDPSIDLQAVEDDFNCPPEEATKFMEELMPLGDKVVEEMEVGSPTSSS